MRSLVRFVFLGILLPTPFATAQQSKPQPAAGYGNAVEQPAPTLAAALVRELTTLRDAALTDDYAYQRLAHITENIGPRPAGSPQAEAAVNYVADELRKLGLEVKLEEVKVRHWQRGPEQAELVEYPGQVKG